MSSSTWRSRPGGRRGPNTADELTRRLSGTVPDLIRKTLQEWADGPPASAGDADGERANLERDITRALVDAEADRPAAIDDIEASLKGIPDDVALKVLRDWRADLRGQEFRPGSADDRPVELERSHPEAALEVGGLASQPRCGHERASPRFGDAVSPHSGQACRLPTPLGDLPEQVPLGEESLPAEPGWLSQLSSLGTAAATKKAVFPGVFQGRIEHNRHYRTLPGGLNSPQSPAARLATDQPWPTRPPGRQTAAQYSERTAALRNRQFFVDPHPTEFLVAALQQSRRSESGKAVGRLAAATA